MSALSRRPSRAQEPASNPQPGESHGAGAAFAAARTLGRTCVSLSSASLLALTGGCIETSDIIGRGPPPLSTPDPAVEPDAAPPPQRSPDATITVPPPVAFDSGAFNATDAGPSGLGPFGPPQALEMLGPADDPSITADGLELYFDAEGAGPIQVATRASTNDPWGAAMDVETVGDTATGTTPWVTPDGLELYFADDRSGGTGGRDIWWIRRSARDQPWQEAQPLDAINSSMSDYAPGLSSTKLEFVLTRNGNELPSEELFISRRNSVDEAWGEPQLMAVNDPDAKDSDAVFSFNDLELWWVRGVEGRGGDLYFARRAAVDEPFGTPQPAEELNSDSSEGDPWLSSDGREVMFFSTRTGTSLLYRATR